MTRLRRLVKQAKVAMEWRGHKPGRVQYALFKDQNGHPVWARIRCIGCHKPVFVTVYPRANEIDIGGEAVALNCDFFGGEGYTSGNAFAPVDLVWVFLPVAEALFTGKADTDELFRIRERIERGYPDVEGILYGDQLQTDFDFICDGLDTCAPKGMYFGSHPTDGARFGFWKIPNYPSY